MTPREDLVILNTIHPMVHSELDKAFRVHKLWESPDPERVLAALAPTLRGLVVDGGPVDEKLLARLPRLEIVASYGVGYDRIDVEAAARRGVVVTNTPGVLDDEVADLAILLLLAVLRELLHADRHVREGRWPSGDYRLTGSLRGRSVGIFGLGRIGKAIARRLEGFGVKIAYCGRNRQAAMPYEHVPDLRQLAAQVDTLVNAAPGGPATRGVIDAGVLRALGRDGVFVNVGRGSTVDEAALIAALKDGAILGAGLDVFEGEPRISPEFARLPNVVLTPHIGAGSHVTREAMGRVLLENITGWFAGRGARNPVPPATQVRS